MIATIERPLSPRAKPTGQSDRALELRTTISASRLSVWLQCRLKFYFRYVAQIQRPPTAKMHAGSTVHAVLQNWNMARWRREAFAIDRFKTLFINQWSKLQESARIN